MDKGDAESATAKDGVVETTGGSTAAASSPLPKRKECFEKPYVVMGHSNLRGQDIDFRLRALCKVLPKRTVPALKNIDALASFFSLEAKLKSLEIDASEIVTL